jgi:CheY-like chemotaxis protein
MPMLKRLFESTIEITIHTRPDLWWVRADPGQIEQVLLNLALNARDAMPEGGTLTFVTENVVISGERTGVGQVYTMAPGEYVLLRVRDTGTGMDEATQRRIFEPFFTTKETGKGTGLGLATAYGIVKQSGGYIEVRTAPGQGAEFLIYLPRTELKTDQFEIPESRTVPPAAGTVLVVEDEQGVRQSLLRILVAEGYKVLAASNGKDGLATFEAHADDVDLLITDIVMPGMGGRDLARKCSDLRNDLKVLYVSGYTKDSLLSQQTFDDGIEFLEKPFTRDSVLKTVRQALR